MIWRIFVFSNSKNLDRIAKVLVFCFFCCCSFYFLRFKASSRQTDRDNRIPWHQILFQRERYKEVKATIEEQKQPKVEKQSSEEEDADFKD